MRNETDIVNTTGSNHHHISSQTLQGTTSSQDEGRSPQVESIHEEGSSSQLIKKKTRGPTYMKHLWAMPVGFKPLKVKFNEKGLPIGETKSQFVEFIGTIAKNGGYAPIDISDWRDMPWDKKKEMLKIVKSERLTSPMVWMDIYYTHWEKDGETGKQL